MNVYKRIDHNAICDIDHLETYKYSAYVLVVGTIAISDNVTI